MISNEESADFNTVNEFVFISRPTVRQWRYKSLYIDSMS